MSLSPGARLGSYEIVSPLGAGGMGEVYKARDTRLDRFVALKVLAAHLAASPQARERFEREAKIVSQLSHPHVCALFDVGHENGTDFLVMELLEGEALSDRLGRGPLPFSDVLRHGIDIADALDRAHVAGIVHRDLKPANVMLTKSGVKLLDFGLAKAMEVAAPKGDIGDGLTASAEASLTAEGALIGTLRYMSPEQVAGKAADARSDIFALGAVLYEMATGRRPFGGDSRAALASAILSSEPEALSATIPQAPGAFDRLVRTCLAKAPERRWQSARDVALLLQAMADPEPPVTPMVARSATRFVPWAIAALATLVAAAVFVQARRTQPVVPLATVRFQVPPPVGRTFVETVEVVPMALSPDGTRLVFVAGEPDGGTRLWLRALSAAEAHPIEGTEGALSVFWSPDGRSIGFFGRGKLKRLDLASGGPALVLCDVRRDMALVGTWGTAGQILFASVEGRAIFGVPSGGGLPVVVVKGDPAQGDARVSWPSFLPDGKRFFYLARDAADAGQLMLGQAGQAPRVLRPVLSPVYYVASGHIVFVQEGTLLGQQFDAARGAVAGEPFPIAEPVRAFASSGWAGFAVSQNGVLAYTSSQNRSRMAWIDRSGRELSGVGVPADSRRVRLSPDGTKALFDRAEPKTGTLDLWTVDLVRNTETRVTSNPSSEIAGAWLPDQSGVIFSASRGGPPHLFRKDLATGAEEELTPAGSMQFTQAVSPDGKTLLYNERTERGDTDVLALPLVGPHTTSPVLASVFTERSPAFSLDGRFLAFVSTESGAPEVYVQSFPGGGSRTRVSTGGGEAPRWSRETHELIYLGSHGEVTSVAVRTIPTLELGRPVTLFTPKRAGGVRADAPGWAGYDVALDGSKFLAILPEVVAIEQPLSVILNWPAAALSRAERAP